MMTSTNVTLAPTSGPSPVDDDWYIVQDGPSKLSAWVPDPARIAPHDIVVQLDGSVHNGDAAVKEGSHSPKDIVNAVTDDIAPLPNSPFELVDIKPTLSPTPSLIGEMAQNLFPLHPPTSSTPTSTEFIFASLQPPGPSPPHDAPMFVTTRRAIPSSPIPTIIPSDTPLYSSSALDRKPSRQLETTVLPLPTGWSAVRDQLRPDLLTQAKPARLFKHLRKRPDENGELTVKPIFEPSPEQVMQICTALYKHASDVYLRDLGDDERYAAVLSRWLRAAKQDFVDWKKAIAPLFRLLSRVDFPLNVLKAHRIGTRAKAVFEAARVDHEDDAEFPAIKTSYNLLHNWILNTLMPRGRTNGSPPTVTPEPEQQPPPKKRKTVPAISPAVAPSTDMSFFDVARGASSLRPSTPPARIPKAISDAKLNVGVGVTSRNLVTQLSPRDVAMVEPNATASFKREAKVEPGPGPSFKKKKMGNKKGHSVRFSDLVPGARPLEEELVFIQAPHEFELPFWFNPEDAEHVGDAVAEGQALRTHEELYEQVAWHEPPDIVGIPPLRISTPEGIAQTQKERDISPVLDATPSPSEAYVGVVGMGETTRAWNPPPPLRQHANHLSNGQSIAPPSTDLNATLRALQSALSQGAQPSYHVAPPASYAPAPAYAAYPPAGYNMPHYAAQNHANARLYTGNTPYAPQPQYPSHQPSSGNGYNSQPYQPQPFHGQQGYAGRFGR